MSGHASSRGLVRREFLTAAAVVPGLAGIPIAHVSAQEPKAAAGNATNGTETCGIPGPYPGRVIEVRNPRMIETASRAARRSRRLWTGHERADRRRRCDIRLAKLLRARRRGRGQDEPRRQSAGQLVQRADARGHRRPQGRRREDQGHRRLRALSRRFHRRQDARGRSRRHRLDRAGSRIQRQPDRPQGRGQPQDRRPYTDHRLRP